MIERDAIMNRNVFKRINLCACGCGYLVSKPGNKFIKHHHEKMVIGTKRSPETLKKMFEASLNKKPWVPRLCACGCGQEVAKYRKFISGHNNRGKNIIWSKEHRENHANAMKGRTFTEEGRAKLKIVRKKDMSKPERRDQIRNTLKEKWKNENFAHFMFNIQRKEKGKLKPSNPEQYLLEILDSFWPSLWKYTGDGSLWINGKNPDFICNNGKKLIIELFGDYWHRGQDPKDREAIFSPFGYKTLVIWEHELKDFNLVVNRIESFIVDN